MQSVKSKILSLLGLILLITFILISFFHDFLFTQELVLCSVIISLVMFLRLREKEPQAGVEKRKLKVVKIPAEKRNPNFSTIPTKSCSFSSVIQNNEAV